MSQPVKLSDKLVLDARLTAETAERSIAGQIEFWAKLGRAMEPLLQGVQAMALSRAGGVKPISECLESTNSPEGHKRVAEHLKALPYPHYEAADTPGLLIRTTADGKRSTGRFVNRRFEVVKRTRR
ncbi:TA system antitoxin ParD family protein [Haloferula sp.]|uniref:TA system antitoxin ParD family protein n=1 Tax=Haloferula sp. TaxID=2497595 RepID=UPI003C7118D0